MRSFYHYYGGANVLGIIIAIISGALMSIQGIFNTGVTKETSMMPLTAVLEK